MIRFSGRIVFINSPPIKDKLPNNMQSKFYLKLSSTVFIDFPPYFIIVNWMKIVLSKITKKSGLLRKFSKTFTSACFNFLALI
jgi:hypothetical protein